MGGRLPALRRAAAPDVAASLFNATSELDDALEYEGDRQTPAGQGWRKLRANLRAPGRDFQPNCWASVEGTLRTLRVAGFGSAADEARWRDGAALGSTSLQARTIASAPHTP